MKTFWRLLLVIGLLWLTFAIRAYQILVLPAFVDESLHTLRAQAVFDFSDAVASFLLGKLLTYYYLGLLFPENHTALWLSREAIALLSPLSAGLCFAITYRMTRAYWAGIAVIVLYAFNPLLIFFERLALADPLAAMFALGLIWSSIRWANRPTTRGSMEMGMWLGLALLAKLTALPLVAVPFLAIAFLQNGQTLNIRLTALWQQYAVIYGVMVLFLILPLSYAVYQELAQIENKPEMVTTGLFMPEERSRLEQIQYNWATYSSALGAFGLPLSTLMIIAAVGMAAVGRKITYFAVILSLSWGFVLVTSAFPSTRYLVLTFALWLIIAVLVFYAGYQKLEGGRGLRLVLLVMLMIAVLWGEYFIQFAWTDPTQFDYGGQNSWEYFSHTSSGYGIPEAAEKILDLEPNAQMIPVLSTIGNCHSLRFYLPAEHPIKLSCPYFRFYINPILLTPEEWSVYAEQIGYTYVLTENGTAVQAHESEIELIAYYPRPYDGTGIYLLKAPLRPDLAELYQGECIDKMNC